ncbi:hypothetical protein D9M71_279070 [compost metagenome]
MTVTRVPVSMGAAVEVQAKVAACRRSRPSSSFTTIISMAMMASSTSRPRERISAPRVMRSNSRPVISMITNTIDRVSGTAAATTRPTRKPRASRLISITTPRATKNLSMNSFTARRIFSAWSDTLSNFTPRGSSAWMRASSACSDLSSSRPLKCWSMITPSISAGSPWWRMR